MTAIKGFQKYHDLKNSFTVFGLATQLFSILFIVFYTAKIKKENNKSL